MIHQLADDVLMMMPNAADLEGQGIGTVDVTVEGDAGEFFDGTVARDVRPAVLCIDGRTTTAAAVARWVEALDARILEQDVAGQDAEPSASIFDPHKVVFLSTSPEGDLLADWQDRPDLDCVITDPGEHAGMLYAAMIEQALAAMRDPTANALPAEPAPTDGISLRDAIPEHARSAWDARMRDLRDWADGERPDLGS